MVLVLAHYFNLKLFWIQKSSFKNISYLGSFYNNISALIFKAQNLIFLIFLARIFSTKCCIDKIFFSWLDFQ